MRRESWVGDSSPGYASSYSKKASLISLTKCISGPIPESSQVGVPDSTHSLNASKQSPTATPSSAPAAWGRLASTPQANILGTPSQPSNESSVRSSLTASPASPELFGESPALPLALSTHVRSGASPMTPGILSKCVPAFSRVASDSNLIVPNRILGFSPSPASPVNFQPFPGVSA